MQNRQTIKGKLVTRKGEFTFEYFPYHFTDTKVNAYCFDIWDETNPNARKYSFILEIITNGLDLKVMDMYACDYQGKGISIPMILKAKELFGKRIISSSNAHPSRSGESNWVEAIEKVWRPMVSQGLAKYIEECDYYVVL